MRSCTKCNIEQEDLQFYKNPKTGYWQSWCRSCKKKREREKRLDKGVTPKQLTTVTSKHKSCAECQELKPHRDFNASTRGSGGLAAYCKPCHKGRFYDKEYARKATAEYRARNPERWRGLHRVAQYNRKAKVKAADDKTLTNSVMTSIMGQPKCFWCKEEVKKKNRTLEHIVELNNGGLHGVSNCTMSCFSCNSSRPNKSGDFDHLGMKGTH